MKTENCRGGSGADSELSAQLREARPSSTMQLYPILSGWTWASGEPDHPDPTGDRRFDPDLRLPRRRGSVMIIEDDDDIRDTLADILEYEGYLVHVAADGREGLSQLRGGTMPALILLDLMMPRMNGWEFRMEQLRSPQFGGIPVVLLSGAHDVRIQAALLGVREFLGKPIDVPILLEIVRRFCG